jgi:hypothetical protein
LLARSFFSWRAGSTSTRPIALLLGKQLDLLSGEIVKSSPVRTDVKKELHNVHDALASSVADVTMSPLQAASKSSQERLTFDAGAFG